MSVTTVPIQPIKKGSLTKFWIGIGAILLAGGAFAWWSSASIRSDFASEDQFLAESAGAAGVTKTKSGLLIKTIRGGEGKSPTEDDVTIIAITGTLRDGTVFQEPTTGPLPVNGGIPGFAEALKLMQRGGKYQIWIPSKLGYGAQDIPDPKTGAIAIPGGSTLMFDVELQEFMPRAEFETAMKAQQEAMQKQQGGQAGPQGAPQQ